MPCHPFRFRSHPALRWLALVVAWGVAAAAPAADAPGADRFFRVPRMAGALLSPDGRTVAMALAPPGSGRIRLVALDPRTRRFTPLAAFEGADIRSFHWVNDHRLVFDLEDLHDADDDRHHASGLYGVNVDGTGLRQLVSREGADVMQRGGERPLLPWATEFLRSVGDGSDDVYVTLPLEYDEKHVDFLQLQRLNTVHGRVLDVDVPRHSFGWVFDRQGRLRVATTRQDNRESILVRDPSTDAWSTLGEFDRFFDDKAFAPGFIDADGQLYVSANNGGERASVWTYDLARHRIAAQPFLVSRRYDLAPDYLVVNGKLAGLRYEADAEVTQWIAPELEALQARIDKLLPSTVNRLSVADHGDGRFVVIHAFSDHVPGLYFLYDAQDNKLVTLGNVRPDLDPKTMADLEPVHYAARDGLDIPAWLSVPAGQARQKLPLVVLVHGGPYVRGRSWNWDPEVQFLAARGYAVLEPEFRGSTGFGRKLFSAGWKQWGLAMQDDIADAVRWAVAQGIADPDRVCIAGASYGGYAVLMGLVRDPELYRCGVEWVGVTDLDLLFTARWSDLDETWKRYGMPKLIGDPVADAARFKATSPLANADRIRAPLLMAYGGQDHRVPLVHGERLHEALAKRSGEPVQWIVYDDEGHGWRNAADAIDFWDRVAVFLDAHIGARRPAN